VSGQNFGNSCQFVEEAMARSAAGHGRAPPGASCERLGGPALLGALLMALAPGMTASQVVDEVDRGDLYLRGGRLASGAWGCGFAILANHRTREDPHVEWEINVEQVNDGSQIKTSVGAASFMVTRKTRTARAPATGLSFSMEGDSQPVRVQFGGPPDVQGAVHAELQSTEAVRLFEAVSAARFITLVMAFAEAAPQSFRFHFARASGTPAQGALADLCRPLAATQRRP
jgi:hypothetical protein